MQFDISKYAMDQLKIRRISEDVIRNILDNPGQTIVSTDKTIYQSIIEEGDDRYLVRVFVNHLKIPNLVITAYKTSKISKYYEGDL